MKKKFFKIFGLFMVFCFALNAFVSLGYVEAQAKTKKIRINRTELSMNPGNWKKLKLKNLEYEIDDIEWTSSDKAVAKVTKKGWVVALVKGECEITATIKATGEAFSCKVTVDVLKAGERVIDPTKPIVAITFDDGPGANTSELLDTLASYGATATFFMCYYNGSGINRYGADLVRKVYNSGCEVANHTQNHPNLKTSSRETIDSEVNGNAKKIKDIIGNDNRLLLRPPYGSYNDAVKEIANVPLIIWSVDTLDWKYRTYANPTELIMKEVKNQVRDGGIILMHDIHKTSCEAVKTVLPWLIQQGYQVCSVSEMFAARGVKLENGKAYSSCITAEQYKSQNGIKQTKEKFKAGNVYNGKVTGIVNGLNVRTGAGTDNDQLKDDSGNIIQLKPDEAVKVIDTDNDSNGTLWYKVRFDRNDTTYEAYVISTYLKVDLKNPIND